MADDVWVPIFGSEEQEIDEANWLNWYSDNWGEQTETESSSGFSQPVVLTDQYNTVRFWLAGNGATNINVTSATLTQGAKSVSIKVNNQASFYIPPMGRWSDPISVADIDVTESMSLDFVLSGASNVPSISYTPFMCPVVEGTNSLTVPEESYVATTTYLYENNCSTLSGHPTTGTVSQGDGFYNMSDVSTVQLSSYYQYIPAIYTISVEFMATVDRFSIEVDSVWGMVSNFGLSFREGGLYIWIGWGPLVSLLADCAITDTQIMNFTINTITGSISVYIDGELKTTSELPGLIASAEITMVMVQAAFNPVSSGYANIYDFKISHTSFSPQTNLVELTGTGTITVTSNPSAGETITISNSASNAFTFVDHYPNNSTEIQIGATTAATAINIATAINAIAGAEFVATVDGSVITVIGYTSTFAMTTTSAGITISGITETLGAGMLESASVADSITVAEGGKATQENASVADSADGLIDGSAESAGVFTMIDCLGAEMDEGIGATALSDNFDGLIDYMGEEI